MIERIVLTEFQLWLASNGVRKKTVKREKELREEEGEYLVVGGEKLEIREGKMKKRKEDPKYIKGNIKFYNYKFKRSHVIDLKGMFIILNILEVSIKFKNLLEYGVKTQFLK